MPHNAGAADHQKLHITPDLTRIILERPSGEKLRKVIVFVAYPWLLHHQLDLAFAHALKARGVEITVVLCNRVQRSPAQTHGCEVLYTASDPEALCSGCHQGFRDVFQDFLQLPLDAGSSTEEILDRLMPDLADASLSEVINQKLAGVPLFQIAYSTLCTRHRVSPLDQLENWRSLLVNEARIAARVWMALDQYRLYFNDQTHSTAALIFNARFTPYRAAYLYFQSLGIDRYVHERGGSDGNYSIVLNKMCTDPLFHCNPAQLSTLDALSGADRQRCLQLASEKLTSKMRGQNTGWFSWVSPAKSVTDEQEAQIARPLAPIVCIFTSSPDEVDYQPKESSVLARQLELLATVSHQLRSNGLQTWIRHHPNTSPEFNAGGRGAERYIAEASQTASSFDRCFMGNEIVNSLELAQDCSACIALTSSISLEIAFCKRKCIVDSSSLFASLFPDRMVLGLDGNSATYPKDIIEAAIDAEPMNELEYERFLLGVYQIYFVNKHYFSSFGYVETIKLRCPPIDVLRGIPSDQRLAEMTATMVDRLLA